MSAWHRHTAPPREQGFILVTSLIFLVVLTLLAVSAITSATLQDRMATGQREKSRALQDADSALAYVESVLAEPDFFRCAVVAPLNPPSDCPSRIRALPIQIAGSRFTDRAAADYATDAFWNAPAIGHYDPPGKDHTRVDFLVEVMPASPVNQTRAALARAAVIRVTARARASRSATAMVQMIYEID